MAARPHSPTRHLHDVPPHRPATRQSSRAAPRPWCRVRVQAPRSPHAAIGGRHSFWPLDAYGTLGSIVPDPRDAVERSQLLKQLHIDRDTAGGGPRSRARLYAVAAVLVLALAALAWFGVSRWQPPTVRTAVAR